ncbi:uncharacterized protein LOC122787730 isoform X2 [Protopterus annectens]|uniref:uncharacterized protein LOC122787730 isoform X2 n=1 Tax=Protopterus annectens TaxID=7888 RepID=UPI001CFB3A06|nr:uncharacterized protein LOC122787730 isoform X2 [Protopterus annectens]
MQQTLENEDKDTAKKIVDFFLGGAELLLDVLQKEFPALEGILSLVQFGLNCFSGESNDMQFVKDSFQTIDNKLRVLSLDLQNVMKELKKMNIDRMFSETESNIKYLFKLWTDVLNAAPQYRQWRKDEFMQQCSLLSAESCIHNLYDAVKKKGNSSLLESIKDYEEMHLRNIQHFFEGLLKLFYSGLIVSVAYRKMKQENTDDMEDKWKENLEEVTSLMNSVIDECTNKFQDQAKTDLENLVIRYNGNTESKVSNQQLAKEITDFLEDKYHWVSWSVRVYEESKSFFPFSRKYDDAFGNNFFRISSVSNNPSCKIAVSFCVDPKPIEKSKIENTLASMKKKPTAENVAKCISDGIPVHVVHIVNQKGSQFACSFPVDHHYYVYTQDISICIHSDKLAVKQQNQN